MGSPDPETASLRWAQSLELYETFTAIWRDNPKLAAQAGRRVRELMQPVADVRASYAKEWNGKNA